MLFLGGKVIYSVVHDVLSQNMHRLADETAHIVLKDAEDIAVHYKVKQKPSLKDTGVCGRKAPCHLACRSHSGKVSSWKNCEKRKKRKHATRTSLAKNVITPPSPPSHVGRRQGREETKSATRTSLKNVISPRGGGGANDALVPRNVLVACFLFFRFSFLLFLVFFRRGKGGRVGRGGEAGACSPPPARSGRWTGAERNKSRVSG